MAKSEFFSKLNKALAKQSCSSRTSSRDLRDELELSILGNSQARDVRYSWKHTDQLKAYVSEYYYVVKLPIYLQDFPPMNPHLIPAMLNGRPFWLQN